MANELMNTFDSGTDIVTRASFNSRIEQANTNFVDGLDGKAPLASPTFSGTPKVGTDLMYHTGNVTISTTAPVSLLTEGHIHMTY